MSIINLENVSKSYKVKKPLAKKSIYNYFMPEYINVDAVKDLSFSAEEGEVVGYIGSNGAGKSTTIKMLTGVLAASQGKIEVAGYDPIKNRRRLAEQIGVVFGQRSQLYWDLPVIDSFELYKRMYRVDEKEYKVRINDLTDLLDIGSYINRPTRELSLGQRMRAELVAAFVHNPRIVFLDEPTIGLDVIAKKRIRDFMRELQRKGDHTILLTTHDMNDIESVCEKIIVIDKGELLYDGSISMLLDKYAEEATMIIELNQDRNKEYPIVLQHIEQISKLEEGKYKIDFMKSKISECEIIKMISEYGTVHNISIEQMNLDRIMQKILHDE